ncbi:MAG: hypothetical protein COT89_03105 [Candidatus Colwellbacteria bacterium CG10_big_fil_rev_8_21_14_0_10_42_22]|uniref:HIT domain-containing protein n=1 Tax=Candidatus Colwellbacteria bacterium CG10_big_fil_rev_8_21_14_0_10_42_22 TaxID=1974540 RepID=A0A2H0VF51_9BACT|nr:MAG: hypothetical protein COT89_03105 [Candidatus Colwellbacteria bacterium CG10_big_fil_rev_8_21_14_0_10_42_22]
MVVNDTPDSGKGILYNTRWAGDYRGKLEEAEKRGVCIFCLKELERSGRKFRRLDSAIMFENEFPSKGAKIHLLIVSERHVTSPADLHLHEWMDILRMFIQVTEEMGVDGGALVVRFGDSDISGATVHHLHFHLVVPKLDERGLSTPVAFYVG